MSVGPIYQFRDEWNCFSNLWNHPIAVPEVVLPPGLQLETLARTNEHAFVVGKVDPDGREPDEYLAEIEWILDAPNGKTAKLRGSPRGEEQEDGTFRTIRLRPDWEARKYAVMRACLHAKYQPHTEMGAKLLSTGYRLLVEGNAWGDVTWGAVWGEPSDAHTAKGPCWGRGNGKKELELRGDNWLGRLTMLRRAELDCKVR